MASGDVGAGANLLMASEAEMMCEALAIFAVKDIGNPKWLQQHEFIEKLNMQAHINAVSQTDEFVHELLISYDKVGVLIHELMAIEVWREHVYPELVALGFAEKSTMTPYIVLYHEATLVNLLETIFYHKEAPEAAADSVLDLMDYCYRKIVYLNSRTDDDIKRETKLDDLPSSELVKLDGQAQLEHQVRNLPFEIATHAVSIMRYLTDNISNLPLSCMTRMLKTHEGVTKYFDGKWNPIPPADRLKVTKTEAQVWLALYNLTMDNECRKIYEYNTFNKAELLKLRTHFNNVLLDQIPPLAEMRRALEELSMMKPPDPAPSVILEQMPVIREHLLKVNAGKWKALAAYQAKSAFATDADTLKQQAKRFAETYNLDTLEALFPDDPKCAKCGEPAVQRCSRCRNEWYCRRQCQVEHWGKHKKMCNIIAEAAEADKK